MDFLPLLQAMGLALLLSLGLFVLLGKILPGPWARVAGSWVLGLGFLVGCWWVSGRPRWPLAEDQDRLLAVLLPLAVLIETVMAWLPEKSRWPFVVRWLSGFAAAPCLLFGSAYLNDVGVPGACLWSSQETFLWLVGIGLLLALNWIALVWASDRSKPTFAVMGGLNPTLRESAMPLRWLVLCLALIVGGTGLCVMLTGYFSGGQFGPVLAAGMLGCVAASFLGSKPHALHGLLGPAVVLLFSLLIMGRFFGSLPQGPAVVLSLAPLLLTLPSLLPWGERPWILASTRLVLAAAPVALAVLWATRIPDNQATAPTGGSAPNLDYQDWRP